VPNSAAPEPEGDVVDWIAVGDQIPGLRHRHRGSGRLLLVGIARHEAPNPPERHMDKS